MDNIVDPNDDYFFEGTEKLLEIWFDKFEDNSNDCDLRKITRAAWESLLNVVKCEIISFKKNEHLDAYVLSESSMFISKNRFILKTCGSTTLLRCIEPLLFLVKQMTGFDEVADIFYSRKNFLRPELQDDLHRNFESEVALLDTLFEEGAAYCLGRLNSDCWFLYTLNPNTSLGAIGYPDQTLEVIMQKLDPKVMKIFTREVSSSAKEATQKAGIDKIMPGMIIDDFLFTPCGYSMNALIKGGYYIAIHITPEEDFSYELIVRLLKIFIPGKFVLTIFANENSNVSDNIDELRNHHFPGFMRKELQICRFKNYDITYGFFARNPS